MSQPTFKKKNFDLYERTGGDTNAAKPGHINVPQKGKIANPAVEDPSGDEFEMDGKGNEGKATSSPSF